MGLTSTAGLVNSHYPFFTWRGGMWLGMVRVRVLQSRYWLDVDWVARVRHTVGLCGKQTSNGKQRLMLKLIFCRVDASKKQCHWW